MNKVYRLPDASARMLLGSRLQSQRQYLESLYGDGRTDMIECLFGVVVMSIVSSVSSFMVYSYG